MHTLFYKHYALTNIYILVIHQLYMAKLGEQLREKEASQQQGRVSRTERVKQQQSIEREQKRFESLKAQAKKIQEEKFKDKVVQEQYTEMIPKSFDVNDYTRSKWYNKEQYVRDRWLENARRNKYRGDWAVNTYQRTRDKVIPFTLEDTGDNDYSYKDVYDTLSPDLKQFFDTPDVVLQKKAERIDATKQTISEKLSYADQKIAEAKEKAKRKEESNREWYRDKQKRYSGEKLEKYREQYKEKSRDIDNDLDEDIAKWQGYKEGLSKGLGQLNANKDIDFASIESYAYDVANYEESKEEARNEAKENYYSQKAKGELDEAFKQLGLSKDKTSYYNFKQAVTSYNKTVPQANQLIKKGLTPIYSNGKISGYEDAVLGMSYSVDAYNTQFKQQRAKLDINFDADTGMLSVKPNADAVYQDYLDNKKLVLYSDPKPEPTAFTMGNKTYVPTTAPVSAVAFGVSILPKTKSPAP